MTDEEIINKYYYGRNNQSTNPYTNIINAMKKFAIYCCEKQREICAENAKIMAMNHSRISDEYKIDMGSIINSPLPKELQ